MSLSDSNIDSLNIFIEILILVCFLKHIVLCIEYYDIDTLALNPIPTSGGRGAQATASSCGARVAIWRSRWRVGPPLSGAATSRYSSSTTASYSCGLAVGSASDWAALTRTVRHVYVRRGSRYDLATPAMYATVQELIWRA